jgi:hypothetical protein
MRAVVVVMAAVLILCVRLAGAFTKRGTVRQNQSTADYFGFMRQYLGDGKFQRNRCLLQQEKHGWVSHDPGLPLSVSYLGVERSGLAWMQVGRRASGGGLLGGRVGGRAGVGRTERTACCVLLVLVGPCLRVPSRSLVPTAFCSFRASTY